MPAVTAADLKEGKLRLFVYGGTGVGKTVLSGSTILVPEMCPVFYADFEDGVGSISEVLLPSLEANKNVSLWSMRDINDLRMMGAILKEDAPKFKTIVIDSASAWWALLMRMHLEAQGRDAALPQIQDYGIVSDTMLQVLRVAIQKRNVNIVVTCGETAQKDEITGGLYREPALTGQLSQKFPPLFDVVGYLDADITATREGEVKTVKRTLQVQPFGRVRAKSRLPRSFPLVLQDPTMTTIWTAWKNRFNQKEGA